MNVLGDAVDKHFAMDGVQVGDCVAITGTTNGIRCNLWGMKEPD